MDKVRAVKLLDDTFRTNFNIDQFSRFIKELFNEIQINVQDKTPYIAKQFKDGYISECKKIGEYKDSSKKSMEILAVKLIKTTSRDRARTMQRNFISSWLSKQGIDAALVAFYGDDNEDWRFSYVKMEYNLVKNEDEKVIIEKELTPAKRYSFLVGINEPNHTCQRQILELVMEEKTNPSISEIEQAFSIEKVTKEFFEKYKELAFNLRDAMDNIISRDARIRTEFENKGITTLDFSKKLLGQIVFIYFLQKKGWLGVKKKADGTFDEWGTGPKNFLRKAYDKDIVPYENFFNDLLEPLFYEALASDRSTDNDYYSRFKCKIPFLNGGLFEPINDYDWTGTDINIPNEIFSNKIKTKEGDIGTGIFDVFDRYNFTVKEDEPLEKEVAVDPEMLGKVFENLLEVKERKDNGAFYTPREIVHYMCQQSLINYLETNTGNVPRKEIERFVQYGDIALDQTIKSLAQKEIYHGKSYVDEKLLVPKSIADNYQKIDKLLQDIKIVDPAVGSGAFPVGMMNEIVKARSILTVFFSPEEQETRTEYNLKRQCIENSLYGVDIDQSAVEIAKLRFWLSLIVDEEKKENIQPLPNLDHKIMCGNSLLEEFEGIKLFDERLLGEVKTKSPTEVEIDNLNEQISRLNRVLTDIKFGDQRPEIRTSVDELETLKKKKATLEKRLEKEKRLKEKDSQVTIDDALQHRIKESQIKLTKLRKLQKEFFNEQNRNKKKQLREDIDKIEWELIEATLKEQGHEEALAKLNQYRKTKVKPFFLWKLYFAEIFQRKNPGFDVVIANPPYVSYGLRGVGKLSTEDKEIIRRVFPNSAEYKISLYALFMDKSIQLSRMNGVQSLIVPDSFLLGRYFSKIRKLIITTNNIDSILLIMNKVFDANVGFSVVYVFKKSVLKNKPLLSGIVKKSTDIKHRRGLTYSQSYFEGITHNRFRLFFDIKTMNMVKKIEENSYPLGNYLNGHTGVRSLIGQDKIKSKTQNGPTWKKGLLSGSQIGRYWIKYEGDFINIDPNLLNKGGWDPNVILNDKIMIRQTGDRLFAAFDTNRYYHLNNIHSFNAKNHILDYKYLLAIINSSMLSAYYQAITLETGRAMAQTDIETLELLPIKELSLPQQTPFIHLVDQILVITQDNDYIDSPQKQAKVKEIEKEIDKRVYELYRLTGDEIKIVEGKFN